VGIEGLIRDVILVSQPVDVGQIQGVRLGKGFVDEVILGFRVILGT